VNFDSLTTEQKTALHAALVSAYARGALRLRNGAEEIQFESGAEMRRRIEELGVSLGLTQLPSQGGAPAFANPTFTRGL
jgi:hypothetical protein